MCIVHVEMAVHKESYTVCCCSFDKDEALYKQKLPADYKLILKYLEQLRKRFPDEIECRVDDTVQGPFHLMGIYLHYFIVIPCFTSNASACSTPLSLSIIDLERRLSLIRPSSESSFRISKS